MPKEEEQKKQEKQENPEEKKKKQEEVQQETADQIKKALDRLFELLAGVAGEPGGGGQQDQMTALSSIIKQLSKDMKDFMDENKKDLPEEEKEVVKDFGDLLKSMQPEEDAEPGDLSPSTQKDMKDGIRDFLESDSFKDAAASNEPLADVGSSFANNLSLAPKLTLGE